MSRSFVHTVKSVEFKIDGFGSLDVTDFSMTLELGSIPMANIGVTLVGGSKKGVNQNNLTINLLSLETVGARLNKLVSLAVESKTCNFKLEIDSTALSGGNAKSASIELKNWILVSAGLGNVTTTNGFDCVCRIAHPVYKLAMHGGFCTNFNESLKLEKLSNGVKDPVSAGVEVYKQVQKVKNKLKFKDSGDPIKPGGKAASDIMKDVDSVFSEIPSLMSSYLKWSPDMGGGKNGIPMNSLLSDKLKKATKQVMLECWLPMGTMSVWDVFSTIVMPEFSLTLIPDYTKDKLPVCPFYPWRTAKKEIMEDSTYEINYPGTDPAPIYGVCGSPQTMGIDEQRPSTYAGIIAASLDSQASVLAYVPKANSDINGKFFSGALPDWLVSAIEIAPARNPQDIKPSTNGEEIPPEDTPSGSITEHLATNSVKMQCLACQFLNEFKKRLEAMINCPFVTDFIPGDVISVKSEKEVLLQGMIVSLTMTANMHDSTALTGMHLAYCRPDGGYDVVKEVMDKNPMYS